MTAPSIKEALEPCPFCNGVAELLNGGPGNWFVRCTNCKCTTDDVQRDAAVQLWHRRAALATLRPSGERREAIARIIGSFPTHPHDGDEQYVLHDAFPGDYDSRTAKIYELTDAILASGLVQSDPAPSKKEVVGGARREAIARALHQRRYGKWYEGPCAPTDSQRECLEEVDWLIASGLVQNEAGEPTTAMIDAGVAFALSVSLSGEYRWSQYVADLYKTMRAAAILASGLVQDEAAIRADEREKCANKGPKE